MLGRRAEDDLGTDSHDLRERLEVPQSLKRDRKMCKAGTKLVGLFEPLARSRSFIPSPSRLMRITVAQAVRNKASERFDTKPA